MDGASGSGDENGSGGANVGGSSGSGGAAGNGIGGALASGGQGAIAGVPGSAGADGATGAVGGKSGGNAGVSGGAGAAGATGAVGGAAAGGSGGAGGQSVHLVTFTFAGHVTMLLDAASPTADTTPQVGDPFSGSYTFDVNAAPYPGTGTFLETMPGIAGELSLHNLTYSLSGGSAVDGSAPTMLIETEATLYNVIIGPFAVTPDLGGEMHFYWDLSAPTGNMPGTTKLSTTPPLLSAWTQTSTAVSIELHETSGVDYDANGVIDSIEAR
jgi:hypothetical protein